jgi:hypothetical protein
MISYYVEQGQKVYSVSSLANTKVIRLIDEAMTCGDSRGIPLSSIVSKALEHSILDMFDSFLSTNDNQLGCWKGLGCSHVIYTDKNIADSSIDSSKAFEKVNNFFLFIKLIKQLSSYYEL